MSLLSDNDLFIFDWDGTLSTSTLLVAISRLFHKRYDPAYVKAHEEKYRKIVRDYEIDETRGKELAWVYDAYVACFPPYLKACSMETLEFLKRKRKKIALFSDSKSYRLMSELRMLKVTDYFSFVLSASSIDKYKPDPTGIVAVMDKCRVKPSRSVYIGDTASDALAAKFAGIESVLVADGLEDYEKVKSGEPTYLYHSLDAMLKDLKKGR